MMSELVGRRNLPHGGPKAGCDGTRTGAFGSLGCRERQCFPPPAAARWRCGHRLRLSWRADDPAPREHAMAARRTSGPPGCGRGVPYARQCLSKGRCVSRIPAALSRVNTDALLRDPGRALAKQARSALNSRCWMVPRPIAYSPTRPGSP